MNILITIGKKTIDAQIDGYRSLVKAFEKSTGDGGFFWWRCSNLPRTPAQEIEYVYIVLGGRIRWRARVLDYHGPGWIAFDDGRDIFSKGWMQLFDFERLARSEQTKRKGFQGYCYLDS